MDCIAGEVSPCIRSLASPIRRAYPRQEPRAWAASGRPGWRTDPCDRYVRTSLVEDWKKDKELGRVVVKTMNSIYYMKQVKTD